MRRFDNFILAKDIDNDARCKAMLLHYAGEPVFDLSESIGVVRDDTLLQTKAKLTVYFAPRRNFEFEVFTFRQASETLDQFRAILQGLPRTVSFMTRIGKSSLRSCKVREKGLSQVDISLEQLITHL